MKQTIYDIMGDYRELYEMATDEEMSKEFEEALKNTKESIDFSLKEKAFNYAKVCKNLDYDTSQLEGQAEFLKKEIDRINNKIKNNQNNKKRILTVLLEAMELADIPKFKNKEFTIYKSKSVSVEISDAEKALEQDLASIEIKPDKDKIKRKLQAGEQLDFATLTENKFLVIR